MSLEQQILCALQYAIRDEKFEVADHLWSAAEALARDNECGPAGSSRLTIDDVAMIVADALLRPPSRRSAHAKNQPQRLRQQH